MDGIEAGEARPEKPRRHFIAACLAGAGVAAMAHSRPAQADADIAQPSTADDDAFIARAFEMRALATEGGDRPYGAVVVLDGKIVGQSGSRVMLDHDPTAHAEMAAIRDAGRRLKRTQLRTATLYSSSRPCPMCEAAAAWAGIGEMVFGVDASSAGEPQLCR